MGKKSKKKSNKRRRTLKTEKSKVSRFFDRGTNKLIRISCISVVPFLVFNTLFAFDVAVSIEFYFTIIYGVSAILAMFFFFGLVNSFFVNEIWNKKTLKIQYLFGLGEFYF